MYTPRYPVVFLDNSLRFFFAFINSSSMGNPPGKFNLEDKSLRCDLALVTEGGPENKPAEERRATTKVSAIEEQTKNYHGTCSTYLPL